MQTPASEFNQGHSTVTFRGIILARASAVIRIILALRIIVLVHAQICDTQEPTVADPGRY
jgi:hypothetical protein